MEQYRDYETISEKLLRSECPPEVFLLLGGWASGKPVKFASTEQPKATTAGSAAESPK